MTSRKQQRLRQAIRGLWARCPQCVTLLSPHRRRMQLPCPACVKAALKLILKKDL